MWINARVMKKASQHMPMESRRSLGNTLTTCNLKTGEIRRNGKYYRHIWPTKIKSQGWNYSFIKIPSQKNYLLKWLTGPTFPNLPQVPQKVDKYEIRALGAPSAIQVFKTVWSFSPPWKLKGHLLYSSRWHGTGGFTHPKREVTMVNGKGQSMGTEGRKLRSRMLRSPGAGAFAVGQRY